MKRYEDLDEALRRSSRAEADDNEPPAWDRFADVPPRDGERPSGKARKTITATPFRWRDPRSIPLRPWLYGTVYCREIITVTAGPGGYGKSSLVLVEAIAMASGRSLLGIQVTEARRVWYVNLEDDRDEIDRRVMAICLHFGITEDDLGGRLFIDSADECEGMIFVTETREGVQVAEPVVSEVVAEIEAKRIDLLSVDPFVSAHEVDENSNTKINVVKNTFASIARRTSAAVGLVHHVRKGAGAGGFTVEDSRGAKALIDGARVGRVLNGMTTQEGESYGIENPRTYFYLTTGKANFAPASDRREWYRLVSVSLGNGDGPHGPMALPIDLSDRVGVVDTWEPPDAMASVTVSHLRALQNLVASGEWLAAVQAKDRWVGVAVAQVMQIDHADKAHRRTINAALSAWYASGMLVKIKRQNGHREEALFVEVGERATD